MFEYFFEIFFLFQLPTLPLCILTTLKFFLFEKWFYKKVILLFQEFFQFELVSSDG
jgi:hypothetical protein